MFLSVDSRKLTSYFNECLQTGLNICIKESKENPSNPSLSGPSTSVFNPNPSLSGPSTSNALKLRRKVKFSFLCGTFEKQNFIYAVKFANHPWHYFEENDSISSQHDSLPASIDAMISSLDKVKSIDLNLNEEQRKDYYNDDNGKFIFQNKELKTRIQFIFFIFCSFHS